MSYVELHAHSAFTFLEGASLPEQLAERAGDLGYEALAITDRDDVGGLVRFVEASEKVGIRPIFGAEITVRTTPLFDRASVERAQGQGQRPPTRGASYEMGREVFGLVLLAKDATGWSNLCGLISKGRFDRPRGRPYVTMDEIATRSTGLVALSAFLDGPLAPALVSGDVDDGVRLAKPWIDIFGEDFILEVQDHALPEERRAAKTTLAIARKLERTAARGLHGVVATNHVHHVTRSIKPIEDVLRCIKHECAIDDAGDRLFPNAERYLRAPEEMRRRFRHHPDLLRASVEIAERCAFHLKRDLIAPLPCFPEMRPGEEPDTALERLTWEGARVRYPYAFSDAPIDGVRDVAASLPGAEKIHAQLRHELDLVRKMQFAGYFLILYDVVRAAAERKILVQGRGSAANSAICYCLGITAIDPIGREMLFERFLSEGRAEPPDIDVDIEHERREELLQYVYERYGRDHAAMVAAIHTFQPRAAARDVARALGLSVEQGNALAGLCDRFVGMEPWGGSHRTGAAAPHAAQGMDLRRGSASRDGDKRLDTAQWREQASRGASGMDLRRGDNDKRADGPHGEALWRERTSELTAPESDLRRGPTLPQNEPRPDWVDPREWWGEHPRDMTKNVIATIPGHGPAQRIRAQSIPESTPQQANIRAKEGTHESAPAEGYVARMDPDRLKDAGALRAAGLDPSDRRVAMVPWFVERLVGLPRHRAIHSGGFVLCERPIFEVAPVEWASMAGRTILQWEKDDLSTLGLVKFDLLGLGMLTVIQKHLQLIEKHRGVSLGLWQLPHEDPDVFEMICQADTIGLFQIESRAQMNTLPRLQPRQFYDLVVEVALIRPGPIQGEMVHPYLRRRRGEEPITYLHPDLEPHLARTLGVPLFQEQGMKIAIEIGGFSPTEADQLRRAMAHKRSRKAMDELGEKLIGRMTERGYGEDIANRIVKQLTAFADYGFPESHAASFALLVWASAYLKFHYTPEFYAAILNSQPMGFYSASTLVEDAKRHHVVVRGPCVVASDWDCTLEPISPLSWTHGLGDGAREGLDEEVVSRQSSVVSRGPGIANARATRDAMVLREPAEDRRLTTDDERPDIQVQPYALRIGLRYVRGLGERTKPWIARAIAPRPRSIHDFVRRAGSGRASGGSLDEGQLLSLAHAGAFDAIEPERRRAIWQVMRLAKTPAGPLDLPGIERDAPTFPIQSGSDLVAADFQRVGLTPREHPMAFLRGELDARGVVAASALVKCGRRIVKIAGLVICRQRPATAKGFVFLTLEDEGGMVNVVVEPKLFVARRQIIVANAALEIEGDLQREQGVVNVKANTIRALSLPWASGARSHDFH